MPKSHARQSSASRVRELLENGIAHKTMHNHQNKSVQTTRSMSLSKPAPANTQTICVQKVLPVWFCIVFSSLIVLCLKVNSYFQFISKLSIVPWNSKNSSYVSRRVQSTINKVHLFDSMIHCETFFRCFAVCEQSRACLIQR